MNAANRINNLKENTSGNFLTARGSIDKLPKLKNVERTPQNQTLKLGKSSSVILVENLDNMYDSMSYVNKALMYAENNHIPKAEELGSTDEQGVKIKRFLEIDRFVKSYRRSNQKSHKIPSFQDIQYEINEMERKRKLFKRKKNMSIPANLMKVKTPNSIDDDETESESNKGFTFRRNMPEIKPTHPLKLSSRSQSYDGHMDVAMSGYSKHKVDSSATPINFSHKIMNKKDLIQKLKQGSG